jgi:dynactin complex subunit
MKYRLQIYWCNIQGGSLYLFSVLQEEVHKKQRSAFHELENLLAIRIYL